MRGEHIDASAPSIIYCIPSDNSEGTSVSRMNIPRRLGGNVTSDVVTYRIIHFTQRWR